MTKNVLYHQEYFHDQQNIKTIKLNKTKRNSLLSIKTANLIHTINQIIFVNYKKIRNIFIIQLKPGPTKLDKLHYQRSL